MQYLITEFFKAHPFLFASQVAKKAGINPSLMRQYTIGIKAPSAKRLKKIEFAIQQIGIDLISVKLAE